MKLNKIAFAALAVASTGAFAAVTPLCTTEPTTGADLVGKCSPEVTFFATGGTAMRDAYKEVMYTMFDNTKPLVYVKKLKADTTENKDQFAMYGFAKTTAANTTAGISGKRLAVIVNTANGTMAGVNMVITGGKTGSLVNNVNGNEFNSTIALQTAANMKAAVAYAPAGMTISADAASGVALPVTTGTKLQLVTLPNGVGEADFKLGWGVDKNKVANIAFADVRPTEAIPGQLSGGKWDTVKFPWSTLAMQGFQVVVNKTMYNALVARDVTAGRLDSGCAAVTTGTLTVAQLKCQPTIFSTEMATLMNGKRPSSLGITSDSTDATKITFNRRVDSSGTQSAAQAFFTKLADYGVKGARTFDGVLGATLSDGQTVNGATTAQNMLIKAHSSSDNLVAAVPADTTGYSIGFVSNDKGGYISATANILSVKIDGMSPNFDGSAADSSAKVTLAKGYPFQFEFGAVALAANKAPQAQVAANFIAGLGDAANNLKGVVYTSQSAYSRKGNNLGALSE